MRVQSVHTRDKAVRLVTIQEPTHAAYGGEEEEGDDLGTPQTPAGGLCPPAPPTEPLPSLNVQEGDDI